MEHTRMFWAMVTDPEFSVFRVDGDLIHFKTGRDINRLVEKHTNYRCWVEFVRKLTTHGWSVSDNVIFCPDLGEDTEQVFQRIVADPESTAVTDTYIQIHDMTAFDRCVRVHSHHTSLHNMWPKLYSRGWRQLVGNTVTLFKVGQQPPPSEPRPQPVEGPLTFTSVAEIQAMYRSGAITENQAIGYMIDRYPGIVPQ